jgi:beta-lactamase superfamily II metal-dependent hydrolase
LRAARAAFASTAIADDAIGPVRPIGIYFFEEDGMQNKIVGNDLLKVYEKVGDKKKIITILAWGDPIAVGGGNGDEIEVTLDARFLKNGDYVNKQVNGFISAKARLLNASENDVVKYSICDVQQGDASILETPSGKRIFFDGGEKQMFARYLAARYNKNNSQDNRLAVDAIVVTHGDKDHLGGLIEIAKAEKNPSPAKRIFIQPKAVFHNGLVKGDADDPAAAFGPTAVNSGDNERYVTQLADDITQVPAARMNTNFVKWRKVLDAWKKNGVVKIQRLSDKVNAGAFDFLNNDGIKVRVLGPIEAEVDGQPALQLFKTPLKELPEAQGEAIGTNLKLSKSYSVSHTINGHSLVLLFEYGNVRLLLTGDINKQAALRMLTHTVAGNFPNRVDILKVPHHGSADFSTAFLDQLKPVISVVSSGDENERVEFIHPRATLVGALGKYSRIPQPIVFCTELAAFYKYMGQARLVNADGTAKGDKFYAQQRTAYGIIHFCFNRERILVFSHSGKRDLKEAYAIRINADGTAEPDKVTVA